MSSDLIAQATLSGLVNGCVYALIGIGLAVVFKGTRIINAVQGEFAVVGAMVTVLGLNGFALPYAVSIAGGILAGAASGVAVDLLFVRPMARRSASEESYLLLTIGLAFTLSAAVLYVVGRDPQLLPSLGRDEVVEIFGAYLREHALWLVGVTLVVVAVLRLFYARTLLGLAMAAASMDPDGAATTGIDVARMRALTFFLGGGLGALAGILLAPLVAVSYQSGIALTLKGFAAAIIGGLTNPLGALLGGLVMGLLESLAVVGFPSGYKDIVALLALVAVMIAMPHGLLGHAGRKGG